ncbi:hypothetical protein N7522_001649 [Penicillium canescens]|uniref:Zn(2)-C6 fungal-type domain-containing protein n=1 Tax=Penicillium canescens TaxID=5083 RepID=A0AAD6NE25_PENCN|nr:uncharacterized protein N7446_008525 [Penicillium canescens]KAJ6019582.1 hypothetical protein N7522_001649 [Penicillium canescens]KAJ6033183.1 hypothetical protein N7444_010954 [Penicillium canescens]KAJ6057628.1 hypothetical protein N7460_000902 [Penicillium canescens]KAJ6058942.1 hypothetical protein N7446_008525 [Penicillium canescens]
MQPSAAMDLRDSFGDRKIPDISRKITACVLCRKLKIKCHMNNDKPPCNRCKSRGLSCTVNKSLQMLLENDVLWKEKMEGRMSRLEQSIIQSTNQPPRITAGNAAPWQQPLSIDNAETERVNIQTNPQNNNISGTITLNLSCSLGAFPASSMVSLTPSDMTNSGQTPDPISREIISQETAENMFAYYKRTLDPCIHHILDENETLTVIRTRSPLLTTAVTTVAAFCNGSKNYNALLELFKNQVSAKMFSNNRSFDDVRALCIGALWLNEVSTALNSLAVRIAAELDLHRCITKMPHTKRACYDRTRLYWLVYICDHHCSLIHGRPPLTRDFQSLRRPRDFLQSYFTTPSDLTMISQVELWSISSRVFDMFGADIECHVAAQRPDELARLSIAYNRWREEWLGMLSFTNSPAGFSRRVFDLHYYSATLYLFSHVFRGSQSQSQSHATKLPTGSDTNANTFVNGAIRSAFAIIRCIVDVDDNNKSLWLEMLPPYIGTMVAFACVCLVRVSRQQTPLACDMHDEDIPGYLHRLVQVLRLSPVMDQPAHPLVSITRSLETATTTAGQEFSHDPSTWNEIRDLDLDLDLGVFDIFTSDSFNGCIDNHGASFSGL